MRLRIKDLATKVGSGVTPKGGASVYQDNGIPLFRSQNVTNDGFLLDDIAYISEEIHKSMIGTRLMPNDVLLNITGASIGRCYYLPKNFKEGNVNQHVCIIRSKVNVVIPAFLYYNLISAVGQQMIDVCQTGANREGLTKENICNFEFDIPSLADQQRMITYLDTKLSEIDHQVSLLTSKRDAYLRLKKSIINHAVTRGLDPNVKMKDSGIEWIGEVPEHWEVKRMKDIFFERKELSLTGEEDLLSVSEFYGVARRKDKMNSDEEFESRADSLVGYKICKAHDLVINIMLAWKTGLGISDNDGIVSPAYAVYEGRNIASHFYHYLLRSGMYVKEFKRHSKGIIDSRLRLYNDRFNNISAIYPPLPEQRAIATYLDDKCAKIDTIVSNLNKQISRYADLKRSLIDEVITGKRAV